MEAYNLQTLINNYYLIVPEIQREYVWGAKENIEKFNLFIDDVLKSVQHNEKKNVGFLYSYKTGIEERESHGVEHYIIDGQQRLTSLILLLYVLASKEERRKDFQNLLHSNEPTMKFSYNVRPLTEHFFRLMVNQNQCEQHIRENIWYTKDFERDMTITSMVNAVETLYEREDVTSEKLYDAVLKNVTFWYFDVEQTSQGEELYISMNSRGQKLTESEQIKPRLLKDASEEQSKKWDDMEEFFFHNQNTKERKIEAVDYAVNNFIKLVIEICTGSEINNIDPIKHSTKISIQKVLAYFDCLKYIFEQHLLTTEEKSNLYENSIDRYSKYVLEALLIGIKKDEDNDELNRIKRIVSNTLAYAPKTGYNQFFESFLKLLVEKEDKKLHVYDYIVANHDRFAGFIPQYEYEKIEGITENQVKESDIERAEKYAFFDGRIHFLYHNEDGKINWESFTKKFDAVIEYFDEKGVKSEYKPFLLRRLVSFFDHWGLFWNIVYDNSKEAWLHILVDETWIQPVHKLLLCSQVEESLDDFNSLLDDEVHQMVHNDLVKTNLLSEIGPKFELGWKFDNYYIAPKKSHYYTPRFIIIGNQRNRMLQDLHDCIQTKQSIENTQFYFYWGRDISFNYQRDNQNYNLKWLYNNKIIICNENWEEQNSYLEVQNMSSKQIRDGLNELCSPSQLR